MGHFKWFLLPKTIWWRFFLLEKRRKKSLFSFIMVTAPLGMEGLAFLFLNYVKVLKFFFSFHSKYLSYPCLEVTSKLYVSIDTTWQCYWVSVCLTWIFLITKHVCIFNLHANVLFIFWYLCCDSWVTRLSAK